MSQRSDQLNQTILWAARDVFLEAGFQRASMDDVAIRAGTTKRTVYAHFKNKEQLFLCCFEMVRGFFLGRLRTPESYSDNPTEALVLFCGRFMETLCYKEAIRMCRVCAAEASTFPNEAANYCYVVFSEVEARIAVYMKSVFRLSSHAGDEAAQRLLSRVLYPRFPRTLFGVDAPIESFDEHGLSAAFDIAPIRQAVAETMTLLGVQS
jgi:AcrR family transcriptional regulator